MVDVASGSWRTVGLPAAFFPQGALARAGQQTHTLAPDKYDGDRTPPLRGTLRYFLAKIYCINTGSLDRGRFSVCCPDLRTAQIHFDR